MNPPKEPTLEFSSKTISRIVEEACARIPPLWPLEDFVAVNPFLGLADQHFLKAAALLRRNAHGEILMSESYYRKCLESARISEEDLRAAVDLARATLPPPWSAAIQSITSESLLHQLRTEGQKNLTERILSFADALDENQGTPWGPFITDEISKWCSVFYDEGQSSWRMPWRDQSLYEAWLEAARHDANPRLSGWNSFDEVVSALPGDPLVAIEQALSLLSIPIGLHADFLHRQLLTVSGWSSYVQYRVRQDKMHQRPNSSLVDLLAIRLSYDRALWEEFRPNGKIAKLWEEKLVSMQQFQPELDLWPRFIALLAAEKAYQRQLFQKLRSSNAVQPKKPLVQVVFCIDVRSERFRRHLEAQDGRIVTSGFAGFFGMPLEYIPLGARHGTAQCPVLLTPKYRVREGLRAGNTLTLEKVLRRQFFGQRVGHAWNAFKTSAISCFSFVETAGLWFGYKLCRDALAAGHAGDHDHPCSTGPRLETRHTHSGELSSGIPLEEQVNLAEGALRNLGLTSDFPRLVLFCGHGSTSANNPYASGLDCGACGGHSGQINARVAAQILNQASVRKALENRGLLLPDDTLFLAGQHNTTTDDVELFNTDEIPSSHHEEFLQLRKWLHQATQGTRSERAAGLGLKGDEPRLEIALRNRSRDWSQVRPEWGLSSNAALIAAPRARTRGLNLEGRTFLHDYDHTKDPEGKVLELILTAPVIVANWINLQYYASTVNNPLFGSGNKTIHNIVGTLGVWQGNGGDLQVGLPMQSLHNGEDWMHEPLRLSVLVEAPRESINLILAKHLPVRELVQNGWFSLFALDPNNDHPWQYTTSFNWLPA